MRDAGNDSKILQILAEDNSKGFKMLVELYSKRLYWHIRRLVVLHEDADDALQNTFIKCWKNINSFRMESSLFTWLYSIATNEALMIIRKRNRMSEVSVDDVKDIFLMSSEGDTWFNGDEAEVLLQNAILTLPEKQKVVFMLKYYDEMTYEEMSSVTGTSVGALKASYFHAVRKIEKVITS